MNYGTLALSSATPGANVSLSAPYVLINSKGGHIDNNGDNGSQVILTANNYARPAPAHSPLMPISSTWNTPSSGRPTSFKNNEKGTTTLPYLPDFATVSLTSQGDIRFLAPPSVDNASIDIFASHDNIDPDSGAYLSRDGRLGCRHRGRVSQWRDIASG